jgi:hypothetical protein
MNEQAEIYVDMISGALPRSGDPTPEQLAAIRQYLRVALSEGLDPEAIWAEVMEFSETAPPLEEVFP